MTIEELKNIAEAEGLKVSILEENDPLFKELDAQSKEGTGYGLTNQEILVLTDEKGEVVDLPPAVVESLGDRVNTLPEFAQIHTFRGEKGVAATFKLMGERDPHRDEDGNLVQVVFGANAEDNPFENWQQTPAPGDVIKLLIQEKGALRSPLIPDGNGGLSPHPQAVFRRTGRSVARAAAPRIYSPADVVRERTDLSTLIQREEQIQEHQFLTQTGQDDLTKLQLETEQNKIRLQKIQIEALERLSSGSASSESVKSLMDMAKSLS